MENKDSKNPAAVQSDPASSDRRAFMRTVVTGSVAAGIAATVGKAEAAPVSSAAYTEVPRAVVSAKVLLNKAYPVDRQHIIDVIGGIFDGSCCPNCGLGGVPDPNPGTVTDIKVEMAYLSKDIKSTVVYTDSGSGSGC
jgi:hypothetical protein